MKRLKRWGAQSLWACTLSITGVNSPVSFTANQNPSGQTFGIRRSNSGQSCSFFVGFTKGSSGSYNRTLVKSGGATVPFNLSKTSAIGDPPLKDYPDASSATTDVFTGSFTNGSGGNTRTFTYYPKATSWSSTNNHRFGLHSDTVDIKVYEGAFPPVGVPTLDDSSSVVYNYTVPKRILVSLLGTGVSYSDPAVTSKTLNFGTMSTGQSNSFDLVLIYNAGYSVSFNSLNGQRLKHNSLNSYVPYTVTMSGVGSFPALTAGADVLVTSGTGLSAAAPTGDRRVTTFTLGSTASAFSGTYSESITITVTSTE